MVTITITLYVQPGAKKTGIVGQYGSHLKLSLKAPPVDGKANAALLAWLAEVLNLKLNQLSLLRGEKSRLKTVRLTLEDHHPLAAVDIYAHLLNKI